MSDVKTAAKTYKRLQKQREAAMPGIVEAVRQAASEGASEVQLAELFGASRMTIRRWLGK